MAYYKSAKYTHAAAIGDRVSGDVLCEFDIRAGGAKNFRAEVHSSDGLDSAMALANSLKATLNVHFA